MEHVRLVAVMVFFVTQGIFAAQVEVPQKEQTVLLGQQATFMCRLSTPLQYCRVEIPGLRSFNLNKGISNDYVSYYGDGLDHGQCGFTIRKATDENNGEIKCTLGLANEAQESVGTMSLVVAKAPKIPELDLSRGTDDLNVYKVDDTLQATCVVRDGRPVANISWFLDDNMVDPSELSMPTVFDLAKENLQSKIQNLTRRLKASDNGKLLRCVAYHPAYEGGEAQAKRRLDIKYPPLPESQPIEVFGYETGKTGVINVTVHANPRPTFEWVVNGQRIKEGSHDNTGIIKAETTYDVGNGSYVASLRIARIGKPDTEKEYLLMAYNDQGSQEYRVKISTNPEPKGYEMGVAAIVGIIVAIVLVIMIVSLLIFAKMSGRWCFSDEKYLTDYKNAGKSESRYIAESSDTESAEVRTKETKRRLPSIQLTSFFKKKQDKITVTERDPETLSEKDKIDAVTIAAEDQVKETQVQIGTEIKKDEAKDKGLVYAELDLVRSGSPQLVPVLKKEDDKTEYAEIVYSPKKESVEGAEEKK